MAECNNSIHIALLAGSVLATASSGFAAEVTSERLIDANREPLLVRRQRHPRLRNLQQRHYSITS